MIRIVGVHGAGKFLPGSAALTSRQMAREWSEALGASEHLPRPASDIDLRIAYYAHLLQPPGDSRSLELDPDVQRLLGEFLEYLAPDPTEVKGSWLFREAAARIAELFGWSAEASLLFLGGFFPEVATYLRREGGFVPREEVMAKVAADLAGADIVVAHSLGSIVAYEALWRYGTQVPLLITIGSPLALPMIFPHLTPPPVDGFGARPAGVRRWINLADHGDVVASPPNGVGGKFRGVHLDLHDDTDSFSFHNEMRYLQSRQFGIALSEWNQELEPEAG